MDQLHYSEMVENLNDLEQSVGLKGLDIYLFGYCNATEELADLFMGKGYCVNAILDNNPSKHGTCYKGITVLPPSALSKSDGACSIVCVAARAYEAMAKQLEQLGYHGKVVKLIDYNSYAEYSLSDGTVKRKWLRVQRGIVLLGKLKEKYPDCFRIFCPFSALGDVYYMMSYLPYFLEQRKIADYVVCTIGDAAAQTVEMFGAQHVESFSQKDMDEQIQAVLYLKDRHAFIPHQDRPYVATLYKALYVKKIPLETIYKCGVFGLPITCEPYRPVRLGIYRKLAEIPKGRAVILSPYAKSVTNIKAEYWKQIVRHFKDKGFMVYTNAAGNEDALLGTIRLEVPLDEIQSVIEWAGIFIGLRSGLCDVVRWADCRKIALYPDMCYSDTKWTMEEMYHLDGWENLVVVPSGR